MGFIFLFLGKDVNLCLYVVSFFNGILFFCIVDYLVLEKRVLKYENYFLVLER